MPSVPVAVLTDFATDLLAAGGLDRQEARLVATSLVGANLRGHDSHGVMQFGTIWTMRRKRWFDRAPSSAWLRNRRRSWWPTAIGGSARRRGERLMERVIVKAKETGTGIGTLVQCSHIGRLGEYCERAAAEGLVSMVMVNTHGNARRVAPPGGKAPRLGNKSDGIRRSQWRCAFGARFQHQCHG